MKNEIDEGAIINRCPWCEVDELYMRYHDEEWGVPVHDDRKHFEFLVLESAQAGLSWHTVLKKRESYRRAYDFFDPVKVSVYGSKKIEKLVNNPGIIRNRKKIEASITNAKGFIQIKHEFGSFDRYIWQFVGFKPIINQWKMVSEIPSRTDLSDMVSKDLKDRGFNFIGSTIIYSHLQATGIVNDHITSCFRYGQLI